MMYPKSALSVALLALFLAGCSDRSPTLGTLISAEGAGLAAIGERWTEGDELAASGRRDIERGNEMIEEGRNLIRRGEGKVDRGIEMKADAAAEYETETGRELPIPE